MSSIILTFLASLGFALLPGGSYFLVYLLISRIDPSLAVLGMLACYVLSSKRECQDPGLCGDVGLVETSPQQASPAQVALLKTLGLTIGYSLPSFYTFSENDVLIWAVALALVLHCRDIWLELIIYAAIALVCFRLAQELTISNPVPAISTALLLPTSKEPRKSSPNPPMDFFIGGITVLVSTLSGISSKGALMFSFKEDHPSLQWGAFVQAIGEGITLCLLAQGIQTPNIALSAELITTSTLPPHPLLCLGVMLTASVLVPYLPVINSPAGAMVGAIVTTVFISGLWGFFFATLGLLITPCFPARVKFLVFLIPILVL